MISIVINIKNGAKYLSRCLNALNKFDDVVIMDNYSTDNSLEIINTYANIRVFQAEFTGMGAARNLAATYAKYDWLLFIDCDEVMHPKLASYVLNLNLSDNHVYQLLRYNFYDNYLIDSSSWGNDWVTRIYNRKQTSYNNFEVHESVITEGFQVKKITKSFLFHFPYDNISGLIDKMQFYSSLYAQQNLGKKQINIYLLPIRTVLSFSKFYLLKGGFRQGIEGLIISAYSAIGVFAKYSKLYELSHKMSVNLVITSLGTVESLLEVIEQLNLQHLLPDKIIFIINMSLFPQVSMQELTTLINNNLILPSLVIETLSLDIEQILTTHITKHERSGYFIQPNNLNSLTNPKFLKQCKSRLIKAKGGYAAKVYRLVD